jgi:hypothetical protein
MAGIEGQLKLVGRRLLWGGGRGAVRFLDL